MSSITVNISGNTAGQTPNFGPYLGSASGGPATTPGPTSTQTTTFAPATTFVPLPPAPTPTPGKASKEEMRQIALAEKEYIESLKYNERVKAYAATVKDETPAFLTPQKKINYMKIFVIWVFAFLLIFLFQFSCAIMPQFPCRTLVALVLLVSVIWTFWLVFSPPPAEAPSSR